MKKMLIIDIIGRFAFFILAGYLMLGTNERVGYLGGLALIALNFFTLMFDSNYSKRNK